MNQLNHDSVELYSLSSNSWTNFGAHTIPFPFGTCDGTLIFPYVNNCCHWFGFVYKSNDDETENVVLSFDMANERFEKIKAPKTTPCSFNSILLVVYCSQN